MVVVVVCEGCSCRVDLCAGAFIFCGKVVDHNDVHCGLLVASWTSSSKVKFGFVSMNTLIGIDIWCCLLSLP